MIDELTQHYLTGTTEQINEIWEDVLTAATRANEAESAQAILGTHQAGKANDVLQALLLGAISKRSDKSGRRLTETSIAQLVASRTCPGMDQSVQQGISTAVDDLVLKLSMEAVTEAT